MGVYRSNNVHALSCKWTRGLHWVYLVEPVWNLAELDADYISRCIKCYHFPFVIQKYLALKIFLARTNPFIWGAQISACIFSNNLVSSIALAYHNNPKSAVLLYKISPLIKKWLDILFKVFFCLLVAFFWYFPTLSNILMT